MRFPLWYVLAVVASTVWVGCDDNSGPSLGQVADVGMTIPDAFVPIERPSRDAMLGDGGMALAGQYGAPCLSDDECDSRICVPDLKAAYALRSALSDASFPARTCCGVGPTLRGRVGCLLSNQDLICEPCTSDAQCDGAPCVETVEGRRCSRVCETDQIV